MASSDSNVQRLTSLARALEEEELLAHQRSALETVAELWREGQMRTALEHLLRVEQYVDWSATSYMRLCLLLAESYARLGLKDNSSEWLAKSQRLLPATALKSLFDVTNVAILHWWGEEVAAIRAANSALTSHSRRSTDPYRHRLLEILGSAYLRVGQIDKAEHCARVMLDLDAPASAAYLLKGEASLWSIVRQHQPFRGQLLLNDALAARPSDVSELAAAATFAYERAFEFAAEHSLARENARIGLIKARLAERPANADFNELEAHIAWLAARGLRYEETVTRVHLGMLLLLHQCPQEARRWLIPLADAAMNHEGALLEHDALYLASVACRDLENHREALFYLDRYNVRIRDEHLTRATVPPPNLERPKIYAEKRMRLFDRRRGDSNESLVDHVVRQLHGAPRTRFSVQQMADMVGVSRRTLETGFRSITQLGPQEYATRVRLAEFERLKNQLSLTPNLNLEELAKSVGFSSLRSLQRSARRMPKAAKRAPEESKEGAGTSQAAPAGLPVYTPPDRRGDQ